MNVIDGQNAITGIIEPPKFNWSSYRNTATALASVVDDGLHQNHDLVTIGPTARVLEEDAGPATADEAAVRGRARDVFAVLVQSSALDLLYVAVELGYCAPSAPRAAATVYAESAGVGEECGEPEERGENGEVHLCCSELYIIRK